MTKFDSQIQSLIQAAQTNHWDQCQISIQNLRLAGGDCWQTYWVESLMLRKRDKDFSTAFKKIEQAIAQFGALFYLVDAGMLCLNSKSLYAECIEFWKSAQATTPKTQAYDPYQIAMHLGHAYAASSRFKEGLMAVVELGIFKLQAGEFVFDLLSLQTRNSIFYFNMACLFAMSGKEKETIQLLEKFIFINSDISLIEKEENFNSIKNSSLFLSFIEIMKKQKYSYICLKKENEFVEIITNPNSHYALRIVQHQTDYELNQFSIGDSQGVARQFSNWAELLIYRDQVIDQRKTEGFVVCEYPFQEEWVATLSNLFDQLYSQIKNGDRELPLESVQFVLEWNYDSLPEDRTRHPLTRSYYYYGSFGEDDNFALMPQIPSSDIFATIIRSALSNHKEMMKMEIEFIHSEHDVGEEFKFYNRGM